MKTAVFVLGLLTIVALLAACVPVEPSDMLPYCKEQYQEALIGYPDLPPAYVGACVSVLQTGKPNALISLCGSESFWQMIEEGDPLISIDSQAACREYIKSLE